MAGQKVAYTLPEQLLKQLQELSERTGITKSVIVMQALERYLNQVDTEKSAK